MHTTFSAWPGHVKTCKMQGPPHHVGLHIACIGPNNL